MVKMGILHDYDLLANQEKSAVGQTCTICGTFPMQFQWSDYSGEAMCINCGCPYQLKWGTDKQQKENNYPYLGLTDKFIVVAKEYWEKRKQFVCYGMMLGPQPGMTNLIDWLEINYPEHINKKKK